MSLDPSFSFFGAKALSIARSASATASALVTAWPVRACRVSAGGAPFTVFLVRKCGSTFKSEQTPEHILPLIVAFYHVQDTFDRPARSPGFSLLGYLGARAHPLAVRTAALHRRRDDSTP
jgi:hypothetical protein